MDQLYKVIDDFCYAFVQNSYMLEDAKFHRKTLL